jgi:hypothetical protein
MVMKKLKIERPGRPISFIVNIPAILIVLLLIWFSGYCVGKAWGHGVHVNKKDSRGIIIPDPCFIVKKETTENGTILQWCDLDYDGKAELIQEILNTPHGPHYLDIYSPEEE